MIQPPTQRAFDVIGFVLFVAAAAAGVIYGNWLLAVALLLVSHYYFGHVRNLR